MPKVKINSINPATWKKNGSVAATPPRQVEDCVNRARSAFPHWREMGLKKRAQILTNAQRLLLQRMDEFGRLITMEMGRPLSESFVMECEASIDLIGYYSRRSNRFLADRPMPLHNIFFKRRKSYIHFQPLGVMGIITPWNWPLLIPLSCIVPALLAGNAVVFKPSELTPLLGARIKALLVDAGMPEAVMQVIQGFGDTGSALVNSSVEKIFFTGSTAVGNKVMQQAAAKLKPVVLELGGNDPAIVCADADIENASSGLVWGGFNNCGQNCNSVERIYVHESIADEFIKKIIEKTRQLHIGNGMNTNIDIGPLASQAQLKKIRKIIRQAKKRGLKILTGGSSLSGQKGYYFQPTVILNHNHSLLVDDEIFGPIIILTIVKDDDQAVFLANQSTYGLAASVWTKNLKYGQALAHRLESGSVMINDCIVSFGIAEAGWSGVKKSGIGWIHGEKGLDEMVNMQYINVESQMNSQKFWWFPYQDSSVQGMKSGLHFLFAHKITDKIKSVPNTLVHFASFLILNNRRKDRL